MRLLVIFLTLYFIIPSLTLAQSQPTTRMLIPLYIYPSVTAYAPVVNANTYRNIDVILNPYNGPSTTIKNNYTNAIVQLRTGGVGIYGYIYTGWGARSMSLVKTDIDNWKSWYNPDGIFIDEVATTSSVLPYYSDLYQYITSKGMKVILNPGTTTTEPYISVADSNCIYESDPSKPLAVPTWSTKYPSSELCILQYAASITQMRNTVSFAKSNNVGYVYVTDATFSYWSSLPAYLAEEASLLSGGVVPTPNTTLYNSADLEPDGDVDGNDFNTLVSNFGLNGIVGFIRSDIIKNGVVDIFDFNKLITNYGQ